MSFVADSQDFTVECPSKGEKALKIELTKELVEITCYKSLLSEANLTFYLSENLNHNNLKNITDIQITKCPNINNALDEIFLGQSLTHLKILYPRELEDGESINIATAFTNLTSLNLESFKYLKLSKQTFKHSKLLKWLKISKVKEFHVSKNLFSSLWNLEELG